MYAYFENKATHSEKLLIRKWLQEEGNEEVFYYYLSVWEAGHLQFQPDVNNALQSFREVLKGNAATREDTLRPTRRAFGAIAMRKVMAAAASLLIVVAVGLYLGRDAFMYTTYMTEYGMTRNILLDDGSEVTLNANSSLKVPRNLDESDMREVWLEGEGFFQITKRPNHVRFAVHTNNVKVEVLGTTFNVNTRRGNTEVVLHEGRVKLTAPLLTTAPVFMSPGDYAFLAASDTSFQKKLVEPAQYNAWQTNKLVFEDTPLKIVAEKIEDYYGVRIEIQDEALARRELTGTLPNNDLGIVLKALSTSHQLKVIRDKDIIIFR